MSDNKIYQEPEIRVISLVLEGSVLAGSVQTGADATGEDVTFGEEFDPWA